MIMVDEVQEFKKPPLATKMRIKGLNKGTSNQARSRCGS
jgi:N12 class adenine-specific DNA methylase